MVPNSEKNCEKRKKKQLPGDSCRDHTSSYEEAEELKDSTKGGFLSCSVRGSLHLTASRGV